MWFVKIVPILQILQYKYEKITTSIFNLPLHQCFFIYLFLLTDGLIQYPIWIYLSLTDDKKRRVLAGKLYVIQNTNNCIIVSDRKFFNQFNFCNELLWVLGTWRSVKLLNLSYHYYITWRYRFKITCFFVLYSL